MSLGSYSKLYKKKTILLLANLKMITFRLFEWKKKLTHGSELAYI